MRDSVCYWSEERKKAECLFGNDDFIKQVQAHTVKKHKKKKQKPSSAYMHKSVSLHKD